MSLRIASRKSSPRDLAASTTACTTETDCTDGVWAVPYGRRAVLIGLFSAAGTAALGHLAHATAHPGACAVTDVAPRAPAPFLSGAGSATMAAPARRTVSDDVPTPALPTLFTSGIGFLSDTGGDPLSGFVRAYRWTTEGTEVRRLGAKVTLPGSAAVRLGVYEDVSGSPDSLLAAPDPLLVHEKGLAMVPLPEPITLEPGAYWLAVAVTDTHARLALRRHGLFLGHEDPEGTSLGIVLAGVGLMIEADRSGLPSTFPEVASIAFSAPLVYM